MRLSVTVAVFIFVSIISARAYDNILFKPLTANTFEPRVGAAYHFPEHKLRLDIGTSIDLYDIKPDENNEIRFGTDFMTYTRLRTEGNLKFPVETSDYFFGINASFKGKTGSLNSSARLRIAHISSHVVDGLADSVVLRRKPFVYSREFVDGVYALAFSGFRPYLGFIYVFSTKPKDIEPVIPQGGFDYTANIYKFIDFVVGYDFKLIGIESKYATSNSAQAGLLLKTTDGRGVLLSFYYFSGRSIHGMFYKDFDSYSAIGFQAYF